MLAAGARFAYGSRDSLSADEVAGRRAEFEGMLDTLEANISSTGGPFLAGADFSLLDAFYAPFLERWAVQLPLSLDFHIRQSLRWPALDGWFDAMDALPAYRQKVKGDAYSWTAAVSAFTRMFAPNGTISDESAALIKRADSAAAAAMRSMPPTEEAEVARQAALTAARKLLENREAILADATNTEAKSQTHIERLDPCDVEYVERMLREATSRLLKRASVSVEPSDEEEELPPMLSRTMAPHEAVACAQAARLVSARLCVPRDLDGLAAAELRSVLHELACEAEAFAWSGSGGLL